MKYFNNKMFYFTEPLEEPCQCIMSCCQHPLQIRRAPGVPVNPLSFSYQCCGCVFCPPQVPRNPESEFPVVAMVNGQLVELDIEARWYSKLLCKIIKMVFCTYFVIFL